MLRSIGISILKRVLPAVAARMIMQEDVMSAADRLARLICDILPGTELERAKARFLSRLASKINEYSRLEQD